MAANVITINGSETLEFTIDDSKMPFLMKYLERLSRDPSETEDVKSLFWEMVIQAIELYYGQKYDTLNSECIIYLRKDGRYNQIVFTEEF